ncbi:hypothetical protein Riv7116_4783 [Rivularia sp. PCC 7116]|nr:hypothetical protein Riv7116_4783 [Rivularia sp. PCC 7116]
MYDYLVDYLNAITPYLSAELVSLNTIARIKKISKTLKPTWGAFLECPLSEDNSTVHFSIHALDNAIKLPSKMRSECIWQRIQQLCMDCNCSQSRLSQEISSIFLDFELSQKNAEIPIPSIFFNLKEGDLQCLNGDIKTFCTWLIKKVVEPLNNRTISAYLQRNLELSLTALPAGAQILELGIMQPSPLDSIQLSISSMSPLAISEYLTRIGWRGSIVEIEKLALFLNEIVDTIVLKIELGITVAPQVSLQCFIYQNLYKDGYWQPLFDFLIENKLCTPKKYAALLNWTGLSYEKYSPIPWPTNLKMISDFLGNRASSILVREVSHIEITYTEKKLDAKAHLWFSPDWD